MIRIAIGGDVCATGINQQPFADGDAGRLFGSLAEALRSADLAIVNLESPFYARPQGILKSGPVLGVPEACVAGLVAGGIDLVGLANNHAMDHSAEGLENTMRVCRTMGIATVGAGASLAEARNFHIRQIGGLRIAVLACAEREFGLAGHSKWGVNPLDPVDFVLNVREHASEFDYLIVLIHGGNEHFRYPRPTLVDTCRFFVEEGADVVICQHSHCVGCIEQYQGGYILYGQGNFIFESATAPDSWREGGLVLIGLDDDRRASIEFVPVAQTAGVRAPARSKARNARLCSTPSPSAPRRSPIPTRWNGAGPISAPTTRRCTCGASGPAAAWPAPSIGSRATSRAATHARGRCGPST